MVEWLGVEDRYSGTAEQRGHRRQVGSIFIARYINAFSLRKPTLENPVRVEIAADFRKEVLILKQLTWHYVILNPLLATQQHGQRKIIKGLVSMLIDSAKEPFEVFPYAFRDRLRIGESDKRVVADYIAGMTERQAHSLYVRMTGTSPGSALH